MSASLIIGAFAGVESRTLAEFNARYDYYTAKGREAYEKGIRNLNASVYAPTAETQCMMLVGFDRAARPSPMPGAPARKD